MRSGASGISHPAALARSFAIRLDRAHPGYPDDYGISADWHDRNIRALAEAVIAGAHLECSGCCDCRMGPDDGGDNQIRIGEASFGGSEWDDSDLPEAMLLLAALVAVLKPARDALIRLALRAGFLSVIVSATSDMRSPLDESPPPRLRSIDALICAPRPGPSRALGAAA